MDLKLEDVRLCVIVRDEMINPAEGILDYVNSIVPYIGRVVIVYTGSVNGAREVLWECESFMLWKLNYNYKKYFISFKLLRFLFMERIQSSLK